MHHPSNTDGCIVSPNKVTILELYCEAWGTCTQCVQTLKFDILKLNENIEIHVKKQNEKKNHAIPNMVPSPLCFVARPLKIHPHEHLPQ